MDFVYALVSLVFIVVPLALVGSILVRKTRRTGVALLAVYILIYVILSQRGQYVEYIGATSDGRRTCYAWGCVNTDPSPFTGRVKTGPSMLGLLFWPLSTFDRTFIHRTILHSPDSRDSRI